mgnify:CR=1 FL=1
MFVRRGGEGRCRRGECEGRVVVVLVPPSAPVVASRRSTRRTCVFADLRQECAVLARREALGQERSEPGTFDHDVAEICATVFVTEGGRGFAQDGRFGGVVERGVDRDGRPARVLEAALAARGRGRVLFTFRSDWTRPARLGPRARRARVAQPAVARRPPRSRAAGQHARAGPVCPVHRALLLQTGPSSVPTRQRSGRSLRLVAACRGGRAVTAVVRRGRGLGSPGLRFELVSSLLQPA